MCACVHDACTHLLLQSTCLILKMGSGVMKCALLRGGTAVNAVYVLHALLMAFLPRPASDIPGSLEGNN